MPLLNVIVEDGSPLISYSSGNWIDSPTSDSELSQYSDKSYHICSSNSAKAVFTFNGTSVSVIGGKSPKYGNYTIQIDSGKPVAGSSFNPTRIFNQTLGGASNLPFGSHTVTLTLTSTNSSQSSVDIDFITFGSPVGATNDLVSTKSVGPDDASISYFPTSSDWSTDQSSGPINRFATRPQANLTTTFMGNAVSVFGPTGPGQGQFLINLDGQVTMLSGQAGAKHDSTLLFFMPNLGPLPHNITMINNNGQQVSFSGFQFFAASPPPPTSTQDPGPSSTDGSSATDSPVASETPFVASNGGFQPTSTPGSQGGLTPINPSNLNGESGNSLSGSRLAGVVVAGVIFALVMIGFLYRYLRMRSRPSDPFDDRRGAARTFPRFSRLFHRDVESPDPGLTDSTRDSLTSNQSDLFVPVQRPPPSLTANGRFQNARWRDHSQLSLTEYRGGGASYTEYRGGGGARY